MIKNANIFRLAAGWLPDQVVAEQALAAGTFAPCGPTQQSSSGWVPPRSTGNTLLEVVGDQWIAKLMVETKSVPAAVLQRAVDKAAEQIERDTGRAPGKKQRKELKEQALLALLPNAFPKRSTHLVWIDPAKHLLVIDATSGTRVDDIATCLVASLEGLAILPLQTRSSAGALMTEWLMQGEATNGFTIDRDAELKSSDEMKSVVRYGRHPLDIDEVREHILQGKAPTKLALTWSSRVSFLLNEAEQLRRIEFLDIVFADGKAGSDDAFDADVAISTAELGRLIDDLVLSLGGELEAADSIIQ